MKRPTVVIVSPALSDANNGNWQTAKRWQNLLADRFDVRIVKDWTAHPATRRDDVMLALHARRSAASIDAWVADCKKAASGLCPTLALILTGTDLYRDIQTDGDAQRSLQSATHLVVLQAQGLLELPVALRARARSIVQSTTSRPTLQKSGRTLRCIAVGHLRSEKSPETLMQAAALLDHCKGLRIDHLGAPLDQNLAEQARLTMSKHPHYRWLGAQAHNATRRRMQQAHVLIHPSRMEGGAHVVMEAVCSGTPVLASHISGNIGMLGEDYAGYFPLGDAKALATLIEQLRIDVRDATRMSSEAFSKTLYARLLQQCAARAPLFSPQRERRELVALVEDLL